MSDAPRSFGELELDRPFSVPMLVRGSSGGVTFGVSALILGVFFAIGMIGQLNSLGDPFVLTCLVVGGLFGGMSLVKLLWNVPRQRWLEVSRAGFVISSRKERVAYEDAQVIGLSFRHTTSGISRINVTLETDRGDVIRCSYEVMAGATDPLAAFWQRLQQTIVRRVTEGTSLLGVGWRLDAAGLEVKRYRKGCPIPIERIQKEIIASTPELTEKFTAAGGSFMTVPSEQLGGYVRSEFDKWTKVIVAAGIKLEQ